ncbi:extracellular solute-binding protein [Beggiatoa leptomitoformis]|uniref:Extracellular solute-binding protein n=1 Tax=Beggiatoa leptomitoformis TaxID=288004 RepID=A0A2N9YBG4_9GAMM|nr:extracellular solute-binding protein [Beggiatoa leptomitoformis]ALG66883.1 extracellular solute-binding protein [Beggiatoa leptomitoformis]AUI67759.1 extracellular solute-binding protein [Beggiatoa leptomitoformis]
MSVINKVTTRRQFLKQSLVLTGAMMTMPKLVQARQALTIAVYGGAFKQIFDQYIYPDFTQATGIDVNSIAIPSSEAWIGQLEVALRNHFIPADVSLVSQMGMAEGQAINVWANLDITASSTVPLVAPHLFQDLTQKQVYGVGAMLRAISLVTDASVYPTAPTHWASLWDNTKKDKLGLMCLVNNSFLLEITALSFFGGIDILNTEEGLLKVFDKLQTLKEQVTLWYRDAEQFPIALHEGEITKGQFYHDAALLAQADGIALNSIFPEEGVVVDAEYWAVTANSARQAEALIFIDYMCQPAIQARLAKYLHVIPVIAQQSLGLSPAELAIPTHFVVPNYAFHREKQDWLAQKWSELIV